MKRDWIQIISSVAVVVGLIILVYEIQLNNLYARLQLADTNWEMWKDRELTTMGGAPASVLAKAIENPEDLSLEEMMIVEAFHQNAVAEMWHSAARSQYNLADPGWRLNNKEITWKNLAYPLGRKWWSDYRETVDESVREAIDEALQERPNAS